MYVCKISVGEFIDSHGKSFLKVFDNLSQAQAWLEPYRKQGFKCYSWEM